MIAREVIYRGRVQGVGFRVTTREIARRFDVTGRVRNLPDGGVEVLVEGEEREVDGFLATLDDQMSNNVLDRVVADVSPRGLTSFEIVR